MSMASVQPPPPNIPTYMVFKWLDRRKQEKIPFTTAATYWIFGMRFSGKSNMLEAIATHYLAGGSTIYDFFSSRDSEALAWCRSPYTKILLIHSDKLHIESPYDTVTVSEFDLAKSEEYQIVITTPRFYVSEEEMFKSLSTLVDLLKWRTVFSKCNYVMIREASRLLTSRVVSGKVKSRLEAEYDFLDLIQEAFHTGTALGIDSLRPLSIDVTVREIADYVIIKRIGRQKLPRELTWILNPYRPDYVQPSYLRRMPVNSFIVITSKDNVGAGKVDLVPWHVRRGENILNNLGITLTVEQKQSSQNGIDIDLAPIDKRRKVTPQLHSQIIQLRSEGLSIDKILEAINYAVAYRTARTEVQAHEQKRCICYQNQEKPM